MEINIINKEISNSKTNQFNQINSKIDFRINLKNAQDLKNKICSKKELTKEALEAISKLESLLKIKITDKDFKKDGTLDILDILKRNSSEITSRDVKYVKDTAMKLLQADVITLKQFREVIEWLALRYKVEQIKEECNYEMLKLKSDMRVKK